MKVRDLTKVFFEDVVIFTQDEEQNEYKDIWQGDAQDVPEELLDKKVEFILPMDKRLDICV